MAISRMNKIVIASHRTEVVELLEELQSYGICQVLNAEEAMVSKEWPELETTGERPRDVEEILSQLAKCIGFLKHYTTITRGIGAVLAPRIVVEDKKYRKAVADQNLIDVVQQCREVELAIEKFQSDAENIQGVLKQLQPWACLDIPIEQIDQLEKAVTFVGLVPSQNFNQVIARANELGVAFQQVGQTSSKTACVFVCLKAESTEFQKILRTLDFEPASFEEMAGTVHEIIGQKQAELSEIHSQLQIQSDKACRLSENLLELQILSDHYSNILKREQIKADAPATQEVVFLEGWVREKDYKKLEKVISRFKATSLNKTEPAKEEEPPVEIENKKIVRPFEVITRLYGMPENYSVDPTVFLAPFFALFFGICLTDAGYGFVMAIILWWILKKIQGDKKAFNMLVICAIMSVIAGVLTGGWFSDTIQTLLPQDSTIGSALNTTREKLMLFDPMQKPMMFFGISIALGYIQVIFGIFVAFFHNIRRKDYIAAICDQLTWIIFLNSLLLFALSKMGLIPELLAGVFLTLVIIQAVVILFFSERQGGWGGRIGMGAFQLFGTVFYFGDILSYVRLMALGMVTSGFGMAVNVIVRLLMDAGWYGWIFGAVIFATLHIINLGLSVLSAFVHTLRLQYVEFFPKFFVGGGRQFKPLCRESNYVIVKE